MMVGPCRDHQSRDVEWEDNFHLKLIDNVLSQMELVTLFYFNEIEGFRLGYPSALTILIKLFGTELDRKICL